VCGAYKGIITKTETCVGTNDPACHTYRGKTLRAEVMFGNPGYTYNLFCLRDASLLEYGDGACSDWSCGVN